MISMLRTSPTFHATPTEKSIDNSTSLFSFMARLLLSLLYHIIICLPNDASPYGDMMHLLRKYDVAPVGRNDVMFAQCAVRHTSLGVAVIIGVANIICRRQTSFKKRTFVARQKCVFCWCEKRDLNPYGCPHAPQTCASADSATLAYRSFLRTCLAIITNVYPFVNTFL